MLFAKVRASHSVTYWKWKVSSYNSDNTVNELPQRWRSLNLAQFDEHEINHTTIEY